MQQDYEYLAKSLSSLAGLPVRYYVSGRFVGLYHHTVFKPDLAIAEEESIFRIPHSVGYYMDENLLCYGLFRAREDDVALVIGPVTPMKIGEKALGQILRKIGEPFSRAAELGAYFASMPSYPLRNFLQILCTVNYFLNHEKIDVDDLLTGEEAPEIASFHIPDAEDSEAVVHNTMELEQELLSYVEYGRTEEMRRLFAKPAAGRPGKMAPEAIRQQKNLLICTATLVTRAAIKGGLNPEAALGLSDWYIQKAEMLNDYTELVRLNAKMVLDFTERTAHARGGLDSELAVSVRNFVLEHIGEAITTEQVAAGIGKSRTYLCKVFREETGTSLNHFILSVKVEEAKRLLTGTGKALADIAFYLGFSSQSHFQNTFKEFCGVTPGKFREKAGQRTSVPLAHWKPSK